MRKVVDYFIHMVRDCNTGRSSMTSATGGAMEAVAILLSLG
jgi:hypothetical protein